MDFNTFWHVFVWYFWVVYCNSNHDLALLGNLNIMDFSFMCIPTSSYPYGVFLYFLIWRNSILIFLTRKKTFCLEKNKKQWLIIFCQEFRLLSIFNAAKMVYHLITSYQTKDEFIYFKKSYKKYISETYYNIN